MKVLKDLGPILGHRNYNVNDNKSDDKNDNNGNKMW